MFPIPFDMLAFLDTTGEHDLQYPAKNYHHNQSSSNGMKNPELYRLEQYRRVKGDGENLARRIHYLSVSI